MGSRGIPASGQLKGQHTYTHTHPHHARTTHAFTHPSIPSVGMCVGVCMDGGRYIGWPYFYNLLVGPSYIPSPLYLATVSHVHTHALPTPIHACMKGSRPKVTGRLGKRGCGCASVWWGPYAYRNHRRWARVEAVFIRK